MSNKSLIAKGINWNDMQKRLCPQIPEEHPILIGLSFGGMWDGYLR
jgi:hypothetical protein